MSSRSGSRETAPDRILKTQSETNFQTIVGSLESNDLRASPCAVRTCHLYEVIGLHYSASANGGIAIGEARTQVAPVLHSYWRYGRRYFHTHQATMQLQVKAQAPYKAVMAPPVLSHRCQFRRLGSTSTTSQICCKVWPSQTHCQPAFEQDEYVCFAAVSSAQLDYTACNWRLQL